jgi:hypothetical protein
MDLTEKFFINKFAQELRCEFNHQFHNLSMGYQEAICKDHSSDNDSFKDASRDVQDYYREVAKVVYWRLFEGLS